MKKWSVVAACGLAFFLTASLHANEQPGRDDPSLRPEVQDVVFYGPARPVLIRLHILVHGKPFSQAWEDYIQKRFQFADTDCNGTLSDKEIKRVPTAQELLQLFRGYPYYTGRGNSMRIQDADGDNDGKVTLDELRAYYHKFKADAVQFAPTSAAAAYASNLSDALFKRLDRDKNGKLSPEELALGEKLLTKLDSDDDETLDPQDVLATGTLNQYRLGGAGQAMPGMGGRMPNGSGDSAFFLVPKERSARTLTVRLQMGKELIDRYDKDKSGKLNPQEIALSKERFDFLDGNKDGLLDSVEMLRWIIVSPDVEMIVRLGDLGETKNGVEVVTDPENKAPLAKAIRRSSSDGVALELGDAQIDLRRIEVANSVAQRYQPYFMRIFQTLDKENTGVIDLKQLEDPRYRVQAAMLGVADKDDNGKVTQKEFEEFVELQTDGMNRTITLSVGDLGRGLFEMLDANRDGRLSTRELRNAAGRLAAYDTNKDGAIAETEIPRQYQVAVSAGLLLNNAGVRTPSYPGVSRPAPVPTLGPVWFRKMDRNGDGDVSRREFLGKLEHFQQLDTDKDGFISLEEAEKADKLLRSAKSK